MTPDLFFVPAVIAIDDTVREAVAAGAVFVFNLSGGKDSTASAKLVMDYLDQQGHPRELRVAIHADLGRAEWRSTPETVRRQAAELGLDLIVVERRAGDLFARFERRFELGKGRYEALETYNLVGPWSSNNNRFCTSELKAQVIGAYLARRFRGRRIVQILGIRREEGRSAGSRRRNAPISERDYRFAKPGNKAGTEMLIWHPAVEWTTQQVFDCHSRHDLPLHEAYTTYGSTRLSCAFCVLASIHDLRAAASAAGNVDAYRHLVDLEATSTFSFQGDRWLGDVAPLALTEGGRKDLERGKRGAELRQGIEARMPPGLRYVKGWPVRVPTLDEAVAIAAARRPILDQHGLEDRYPSAPAVIRRFEELMELKERKAAAK